MRRLFATLLWLVLALAASPRAQEFSAGSENAPAPANVVVRQSLDPQTGAVIGQRVALYVDVLFRGDMPRPPRVSLPDAPGLQAFRFETQGLTIRDAISGEPYVGQRFEFALYPRRGGQLEVPAAAVTLLDAHGDAVGRAQGEPKRLDVASPPGVDASQPVVATRSFRLVEQWAPEPKAQLKAGDAIVRTITRTAEDVPALAMRDLAFPAPAGVSVYVDPPDVDDRSDRGVVTGRRVDRVTYVFERAGRFELPPATQPWWDLGEGALKTETAQGAAFDVVAAPMATDDGVSLRAALAGVAAAAALAGLALLVARVLRRRRTSAAHAERESFAALRRACLNATADAGAVYVAFSRWRSFLDPIARRSATEAAAGLEKALFAGGERRWSSADAGEFINRAAGVRRSAPAGRRPADLSPLNP